MPIAETLSNSLHNQLNREVATASIFGLGGIALTVAGLDTTIRGFEHQDLVGIGFGTFELLLATQPATDFRQHLHALNATPHTNGKK